MEDGMGWMGWMGDSLNGLPLEGNGLGEVDSACHAF